MPWRQARESLMQSHQQPVYLGVLPGATLWQGTRGALLTRIKSAHLLFYFILFRPFFAYGTHTADAGMPCTVKSP